MAVWSGDAVDDDRIRRRNPISYWTTTHFSKTEINAELYIHSSYQVF